MGITVTIENGRPVGYLTSAEFAQKCGVVEATVRGWAKRKKLKTLLKIGSDLWISKSEEYPMRRKRADNKKTDIDFECFYFVEDVAAILEVNRETVRRWIRSGKLRAKATSKRNGYRISLDNLMEFAKTYSTKTRVLLKSKGLA